MNIIIGTAGHIDHGKTSLIKKLTSIDTDRLKEEKERGLSIDLGFAYLDLPELPGIGRVGIVDVPGHERFIKNMLSGITGIDIVLFVVAADDGIMPQTREHLDIVNLLGVNKGVFVITKSDLASVSRIQEVRDDIKRVIKDTTLSSAEILDFSSVTGVGVQQLKTSLSKLCLGAKKDENKNIFRLPIDRVFTVKGFGTVVTGTLASGTVQAGSDVAIFPKDKKPYRIRGLHSHGEEVKELWRGQRGAVNLSSASVAVMARGDMLIDPKHFNLASKIYRVDCKLSILPNISKEIKDGSELKLYHYSKEVVVKVRLADGVIKKEKSGQSSYCRLYLREPLVMTRGDRFILRDTAKNRTVGGGECLLPYFKKQKLPQIKNNKEHFKQISDKDNKKFSDWILSEKVSTVMGRPKMEYEYIMNLNVGEKLPGNVSLLGDYYSNVENIKYIEDKIVNRVKEGNASREVTDGELMKAVYGLKPLKKINPLLNPFLKVIIDKLVKSKSLYKNGPVYTFKNSGSAEVLPLLDEEKATLDKFNEGFKSTKVSAIEGLDISGSKLKPVIAKLQKNSYIVRLTDGVYIKKDAATLAEGRLKEFLKKNDNIKVSDFRDLLGCGRKLTMELLDYFDREGVTLRDGDFRKLRK